MGVGSFDCLGGGARRDMFDCVLRHGAHGTATRTGRLVRNAQCADVGPIEEGAPAIPAATLRDSPGISSKRREILGATLTIHNIHTSFSL